MNRVPRRLAAALLAAALPAAALLAATRLAPLAAQAPPAAGAAGTGAGQHADALKRLFESAFPDDPAGAALPAGGRERFLAVLGSEAFLHEAIGPFDVYVFKADGLRKGAEAKKLLDRAVTGLQPLVPVMQKRFGRSTGAVSGRRIPLVLCSARRDRGETSFDDLLALLDDCEDRGFSGWKPDLPVWTEGNRGAARAGNWDLLLFNVAQQEIAQQEKAWLDHGLGYDAINQVLNRLFAKGAWGPPPPWLRQGLLDELDIEAFGSAWVAAGESTSWKTTTAGWSREGWSGFVPEGQSPPPPVTGPPPGLSKTFETKVESDTWLSRGESGTRHWTALVADRKSEAPASLCAMAAAQSYAPRDRAYARCVLHLLLDVAQPGDLLAGCDRESSVTRSGMRDADPLPVVAARALGGLPDMDKLEARTLQDVIVAAGRDDMLKRITELGAAGMLGISDHRAQADWLWGQTQYDDRSRQSLYLFIVQAEGYQELGEWEVIGQALDRATAAALTASTSYPKTEDKRHVVGEAFKASLAPAQPTAPKTWGIHREPGSADG